MHKTNYVDKTIEVTATTPSAKEQSKECETALQNCTVCMKPTYEHIALFPSEIIYSITTLHACAGHRYLRTRIEKRSVM